jgi:hypothetical protein
LHMEQPRFDHEQDETRSEGWERKVRKGDVLLVGAVLVVLRPRREATRAWRPVEAAKAGPSRAAAPGRPHLEAAAVPPPWLHAARGSARARAYPSVLAVGREGGRGRGRGGGGGTAGARLVRCGATSGGRESEDLGVLPGGEDESEED